MSDEPEKKPTEIPVDPVLLARYWKAQTQYQIASHNAQNAQRIVEEAWRNICAAAGVNAETARMDAQRDVLILPPE